MSGNGGGASTTEGAGAGGGGARELLSTSEAWPLLSPSSRTGIHGTIRIELQLLLAPEIKRKKLPSINNYGIINLKTI